MCLADKAKFRNKVTDEPNDPNNDKPFMLNIDFEKNEPYYSSHGTPTVFHSSLNNFGKTLAIGRQIARNSSHPRRFEAFEAWKAFADGRLSKSRYDSVIHDITKT
jgi:hypothetical protein